jgi:hypothetical protein
VSNHISLVIEDTLGALDGLRCSLLELRDGLPSRDGGDSPQMTLAQARATVREATADGSLGELLLAICVLVEKLDRG